MKIVTGELLAVSAALVLAGCAAVGPPRPPSLELPKPPTDLRAVRKGDRVILTWSVPTLTTDHATVRSLGSTRICRATEPILKDCGVPVGEAAPARGEPKSSPASTPQPSNASSPASIPPTSAPSSSSRIASRAVKGGQKTATSYTDALFSADLRPELFGLATYAVEVLNANGRGAGLSNQVRVRLAPTLRPPPDFSAEVTGQGVVLTWRSALVEFANPNPVSFVYRVYRRAEGGKANLVGEVPALGKMNLSLTDSSIEWEQTYYYHVEAVTKIAGDNTADRKKIEVEGDDSAEVKVFAHDVFPPAVPTELQAVFSGPGQQPAIDLVWAPVTDVDLAGYNVYRREGGGAVVRINTEQVKTPAYRDGSVAAGKSYLYSVSAVDVRGNESARSEEAGESVP
jgi:hypothetical protein